MRCHGAFPSSTPPLVLSVPAQRKCVTSAFARESVSAQAAPVSGRQQPQHPDRHLADARCWHGFRGGAPTMTRSGNVNRPVSNQPPILENRRTPMLHGVAHTCVDRSVSWPDTSQRHLTHSLECAQRRPAGPHLAKSKSIFSESRYHEPVPDRFTPVVQAGGIRGTGVGMVGSRSVDRGDLGGCACRRRRGER